MSFIFLFFIIFFFLCRRPFTLATVSETLVAPRLHRRRWRGYDGRLDLVSLGKKSLEKSSGLYRGCLDDQTRENTRISKKLEEVESKHDNLLSYQHEMIGKAFTLIMAEVWSVDPELGYLG